MYFEDIEFTGEDLFATEGSEYASQYPTYGENALYSFLPFTKCKVR